LWNLYGEEEEKKSGGKLADDKREAIHLGKKTVNKRGEDKIV